MGYFWPRLIDKEGVGMSIHTGSMAQTAGALLAVLDAELVLNTNWSVYDASAGTNAKVYRCAGDSKTWYLYIDDNYTTYCIAKIWEGWNATTHVGTGISSGGTIYWRKPAGRWKILLNDTRVVYLTFASNAIHGHYAGQPEHIDPTRNYPIIIGHYSTLGAASPLGTGGTYSSAGFAVCYALRIDASTAELVYCFAFDTSHSEFNRPQTQRSGYMEKRWWFFNSDKKLFGQLDGVFPTGVGNLSEGRVYVFDGVEWFAHGTSYQCLIRNN